MKKCITMTLILCLLLGVMAGCGSSDTARNQTVNQTQTVNDVLNAAGEGSAAPEEDTETGSELADVLPGDYDVDLTKMNSTMVYTEVLQMMQDPDAFLGKTVKMHGAMAAYEAESRNDYACLIADATACCAQGIEFVWKGDHSYPDDYPETGTEIVVTGTFDTYTENGVEYCQLIDAELAF